MTPMENETLIGHASLEAQCLELWNKNRMPHSILLTGAKGIGKATFAYRLARFALSGGGGGDALFAPEDLSVSSDNPVFSRMLAGSHGDLMVISSDTDEGVGTIKIDETRKISTFLSYTPSESPWRVVIVDSADDMNNNAANALLKTLEEPPSHSIIILISHNPGKLLPTIRSRCRKMAMQSLDYDDFKKVMELNGKEMAEQTFRNLHSISSGSPGLALSFFKQEADKLYLNMLDCLANAPSINQEALKELYSKAADSKNKDGWHCLKYMWELFLHRMALLTAGIEYDGMTMEEKGVHQTLAALHPNEFWFKLRELSQQWFRDTETLHLDRKQVIYSMLSTASGAQKP